MSQHVGGVTAPDGDSRGGEDCCKLRNHSVEIGTRGGDVDFLERRYLN